MKSHAKLVPIGILPKDAAELSLIVAVLCIGVCDAIVAGAMTLDDAERYLFNPYTLTELEKRGQGEDITDLIHLGTELSNVGRLLPDKFGSSIAQIKSMALAILNARPADPNAAWIGWLAPFPEK